MNPIGDNIPKKKFSFLKRKNDKPKDEVDINTGTILCKCVGINHAIETCAEACSACWDTKLPVNYEDKAAYVGRRTKTGHTSVLEHSNFIVFLAISKSYAEEALDFVTNCCQYLNKAIDTTSDKDNILLLIGGSYRAYSAMYYNTFDLENPILLAITHELYEHANSNPFLDLCALEILDESLFKNPSIEIQKEENLLISNYGAHETDMFRIVDMPYNEQAIFKNILRVYPKFASEKLLEVADNFMTITVEFKNMTRACTHQLVRHRNGITQESQRYVDYSKASFTSPAKYSDKYSDDTVYEINFGGVTQYMTLPEIGKNIIGIYSSLRDSDKNTKPLLKEDARAFLPNNTQCGKIYMTFTMTHLKKFFKLRCEKHAQEEIRAYATALRDYLYPTDLDKVFINSVDDLMSDVIRDRNKLYIDYLDRMRKDLDKTDAMNQYSSKVDEDTLINAYIDK